MDDRLLDPFDFNDFKDARRLSSEKNCSSDTGSSSSSSLLSASGPSAGSGPTRRRSGDRSITQNEKKMKQTPEIEAGGAANQHLCGHGLAGN